MSYREFGDRSSFALGGDGATAHIHVAGIHLTEFDNRPYWPAFLTSVQAAHRQLSTCLNFLKHEREFQGLSVEEAHRSLLDLSSNQSRLQSDLRFANWGPITDGHICFLLPINGTVYASCSELGSAAVASCKLQPYDAATAIGRFLDEAAQPFAAADGCAAR